MKRLVAWLFGIAMLTVRQTCRRRYHNDPRQILRQQGIPLTYALLHCHQMACICSVEPGVAAMASRSSDGDLVVPALRRCGVTPIRGSSGQGNKGGAVALQQAIRHVRKHGPAAIAIDGPQGPRGKAQPGIALLARKSKAVIIPVCAVPSRRWVFTNSWDRIQIPMPFCTIDIYAGEPIDPSDGLSAREIIQQVEAKLLDLEQRFDPEEARFHYTASSEKDSGSSTAVDTDTTAKAVAA
ncbi:lysophospholipid acyltransferase family protein [Crateriforma conspicua]|nr:lysophospholipid acyltransferase family protein [Crateriforma conspicua]